MKSWTEIRFKVLREEKSKREVSGNGNTLDDFGEDPNPSGAPWLQVEQG